MSSIQSVKEPPVIGVLNTSLFYQNGIHDETLNRFGRSVRVKVPGDADARTILAELERSKLLEMDGMIVSVSPKIDKEVLGALKRLMIVARTGIGHNNVESAVARELGIVTSIVTGDIERNSVAELAAAVLINTARHIPQGIAALERDKWGEKGGMYGPEISGKTVGIIGLGNIGSRTAEILSRGFNCNVLAYDPLPTIEDRCEQFGAKSVSMEALLAESDFVLLHCPAVKDAPPILTAKELGLMKKGALLINTARGELVDEAAVIEAINEGRLMAYGTDVFTGEPALASNPLVQHPKVIAVPHLGGNSFESVFGISRNCVESVHSCLIDGKLPVRPINATEKDADLSKFRFMQRDNLPYKLPEHEYDLYDRTVKPAQSTK